MKWLNILTIAFVICFCTNMSAAQVDVEMQLNNAGFESYDHFKAALYLNNDEQPLNDVWIFGILEIYGEFYYWPTFTNEVSFQESTIAVGESWIDFLEFDFPDIDDVIPFGPMSFWGAWYRNENEYGFDVQEFWLDSDHKWTPTPVPTATPVATDTPVVTASPTVEPTATPTQVPSATPAATATPQQAPPGFAYIPAGSFTMGSSPSEPCHNSAETVHQVTLTRSFYMLETEVTRQMWANLQVSHPALPDDPSNLTHSPTMEHPVNRSTWYEAILFLNLLSQQEALDPCYFKDSGFTTPVNETNYSSDPIYCDFDAFGYRLPTESEWEYACRAGTTGPFSCDEPNYTTSSCGFCIPDYHLELELHSVFCGNSSGSSEPVSSKLPNPWGLYDMHGNLLEWCWDWSWTYPGDSTDPTGPDDGLFKVRRSGSFNDQPELCRSADRNANSPGYRNGYLGFRYVRLATD